MRVEMQDNLQHLQLWANEERNLIKFYQQQAQLYQQLTLVHTNILEGLIAKTDEIRQKNARLL